MQNQTGIVLLHGFFQDSRVFGFIKRQLESDDFLVFTPDLPGFGKHHPQSENEFITENQVSWLRTYLLELEIKQPLLCGYSMGGRLVLQAMKSVQDLVSGFIIESGSNGFEKESERQNRIQNDIRLAELILSDFTTFQQQWTSHPTLIPFQKIDSVIQKELFQIQKDQNPNYLAQSLIYFGTGAMPYLDEEYFKQIRKKALFIAGDHDFKFAEKAKLIAGFNELFTYHLIHNCKHRVHLERPELYLSEIKNFIKSISL